jgi:hypothetical protein
MRESEALTRTTVEAIWSVEAARLIGGLARFVRDADCAEDPRGRSVKWGTLNAPPLIASTSGSVDQMKC